MKRIKIVVALVGLFFLSGGCRAIPSSPVDTGSEASLSTVTEEKEKQAEIIDEQIQEREGQVEKEIK